MLDHADKQPADDIDQHDQNAGDGIAANKLRGAIHRAKEFRFLGNFPPPAFRFGFIDQAGVQVGIDGHLFARHGVEGKAGADLRDTPGALGDDDKVDDGQNDEHHQPDRGIAADNKMPEGLDDLARGIPALMAMEQHDAGRGHVQRQPQQGRHQQDGREGGKIQGPAEVQRHQDHHQRQGDVEGEKDIEQEDRQGQDHHGEHHDDQNRGRQPRKRVAQSGRQRET